MGRIKAERRGDRVVIRIVGESQEEFAEALMSDQQAAIFISELLNVMKR